MSMSNSEARKRAAEKAVEALKAEVARDVAADYDAEIERLTEQRNNASAEVHRLNPLLDEALRKVAAVAAVLDAEYVPLPEHRTDVAHGAVQVITKVRAALADHSEAS